MCQIHKGTSSSIIWELGLDETGWVNSWATPFACLLLNSTWEFWNLLANSFLPTYMIQPNSLQSSICEFTQSATLLNQERNPHCRTGDLTSISKLCVTQQPILHLWHYKISFFILSFKVILLIFLLCRIKKLGIGGLSLDLET